MLASIPTANVIFCLHHTIVLLSHFMLFHKIVPLCFFVSFFPPHLSCFYFSLCFFLLWVFAAAAARYGYAKPPCVCGVKAWHVIRFSAAQVRARLGCDGFCSPLISPEQRTMNCQLKIVTRGLVSICSKRKGIFEEWRTFLI